jgi:hypothetical protein
MARQDMAERHQSVHQRELTRVIQFQSWNSFLAGHCKLCQLAQFAAVQDGLQNILLGVAEGASDLGNRSRTAGRFSTPLKIPRKLSEHCV